MPVAPVFCWGRSIGHSVLPTGPPLMFSSRVSAADTQPASVPLPRQTHGCPHPVCLLASIPPSLQMDAPVLLGLDSGPGCRHLTWHQTLSSPARRALSSKALLEMFPILIPCVPDTAAHTFSPGLLPGHSRDAFSPEASLHGGGTQTKAQFIPCKM